MNPILQTIDDLEINKSHVARELGVSWTSLRELRHYPNAVSPEKRRAFLRAIRGMARDCRRFRLEPGALRELTEKHGLRFSYIASQIGVTRNALWLWNFVPVPDGRGREIEKAVKQIGGRLEKALRETEAH